MARAWTLTAALCALLFAVSACSRPAPTATPVPTPTPTGAPAATAAAETPVPVVLPKDDGPHAGYNTEWWYYNGYVKTETGQEYGFHYVVFDVRVPGLNPFNIYHAAITDYQTREFITGQQSVSAVPASATSTPSPSNSERRVWFGGHFFYANGDWLVAGGGGQDHLEAPVGAFKFKLDLTEDKPPALHGGIGYLDFSPASSTYYYSRTRMDVAGSLTKDGPAEKVTGSAWFDHQWGNFRIQEGGWDWFAVQLDDGRDLMIFQLRDAQGKPFHTYGTLVAKEDGSKDLKGDAIEITATGSWTSPASGGVYPMGWRIAIPEAGLDITIAPVIQEAEFDATSTTFNRYWEGPAAVSGTHTGRAFVELVGYAPFRLPSR